MLDRRSLASDTDINFLANKLDELIDTSHKEVYKVLTDPTIPTRVLIGKAIAKGLIIKMGDFYYLKSGKNKSPMCDEGKDPTLQYAINFLNNPKNQEIKFGLEAQVKEDK